MSENTEEQIIPKTDRSAILVGWGDVVFWTIRPLVYLQDYLFDTDLKDCDKCKMRRYQWNLRWHIPNFFRRK